jgi:2-polyprenyl-3-methyl-5-hydroxy-6-metoxy-1,4-benzoquinol methylase
MSKRTRKQRLHHYKIERNLAEKLRSAPKPERLSMYANVYDELFRLVPHHPQLTKKKSEQLKHAAIKIKMKIIRPLLKANMTFLEIGAGDCSLSSHVAGLVKQVYAVDVSETITQNCDFPKNLKPILSDGSSVTVPRNSIDIVYSYQLIEHLHPEDAYDQLKNILAALVPGGKYLCITPNRLNGPHDISRYFTPKATGFHLKEYTVTELSWLFKSVGFSKVKMYIGAKGKYIRCTILPAILCEKFLEKMPDKIRRNIADTKLIKALINVRLVGVKRKKE